MLREWTQLTAIVATVLLGAPVIGAGQSSDPTGATYRWSGEFVAVDAEAATMTVKTRIAYREAVSALKQFKPGEVVWVVWSGVHDYSDAVRQFRRSQPGTMIGENFVLPAALVSTDAPNQYVTIRLKVPESTVAGLKALKPGEWVTVTSRHRPSNDSQAVVGVRAYGSTTN